MWAALVALAALGSQAQPPAAPRGQGAGGERAGREEAELEAAGVPAWRELWQSSLEALRREPVLEGTEEAVVAQLGAVAFLHCPVRHLAERGVSWVRRRDWHIISSGVLMYTNDERFQVSSGGGTLSRLVHLQVAVPEAFILGAEEYHVDAGSTINLVCIIEKSPVPPQYVFWYHNARMVNYDAALGVSVTTAPTAPGARTHSALTIRTAARAHSGNYTCSAPNADPAHIYVYVTEGSDKMAATLSRDACAARSAHLALVLCALLAHLAPVAPVAHSDHRDHRDHRARRPPLGPGRRVRTRPPRAPPDPISC